MTSLSPGAGVLSVFLAKGGAGLFCVAATGMANMPPVLVTPGSRFAMMLNFSILFGSGDSTLGTGKLRLEKARLGLDDNGSFDVSLYLALLTLVMR